MISHTHTPPGEGQPTRAGNTPCCCGTPVHNIVEEPLAPRVKAAKGGWSGFTSFLLSLGVVFFPKCPICWAAYMSLFSAFGFEHISYQPWMLPVMVVLLIVNLLLLGYATKRKQLGLGPLTLSLIGIALALGGKFMLDAQPVIYTGLGLMFAGTIWGAVPGRVNPIVHQLKTKIKSLLPAGNQEPG